MELGRLAGRADWPQRMVHVVHHLFGLGVALGSTGFGGSVNRHAVVGQRNLALQKRLVVERVIPRRGAGHEGLGQFERVFERLDGLGRVDDDLVFGIDQVGTVRPQCPMHPGIAVAGGAAERKAAGNRLALQIFHQLQEAGVVFRNFLKASLLDHALAVVDEVAVVGHRNRDPLAA